MSVCLLQYGFLEQALHSWISRRCSRNRPQVWKDTWKARMTQQILTPLLENISLTALVDKNNNVNLGFNLGSLQS